LEDLNITKADRAIDELIEKRASERAAANTLALEEERARRYLQGKRGDVIADWREHFLALASTYERLADEAREKAWQMLDAAGRERGR